MKWLARPTLPRVVSMDMKLYSTLTFLLVSTLKPNQTRLKRGKEGGTLRWTSSYLAVGRGGDLNAASNFIQSTLQWTSIPSLGDGDG